MTDQNNDPIVMPAGTDVGGEPYAAPSDAPSSENPTPTLSPDSHAVASDTESQGNADSTVSNGNAPGEPVAAASTAGADSEHGDVHAMLSVIEAFFERLGKDVKTEIAAIRAKL